MKRERNKMKRQEITEDAWKSLGLDAEAGRQQDVRDTDKMSQKHTQTHRHTPKDTTHTHTPMKQHTTAVHNGTECLMDKQASSHQTI